MNKGAAFRNMKYTLLITMSKNSEHIAQILESPPWLSIQKIIIYKIRLLIFKALNACSCSILIIELFDLALNIYSAFLNIEQAHSAKDLSQQMSRNYGTLSLLTL